MTKHMKKGLIVLRSTKEGNESRATLQTNQCFAILSRGQF